MGDRRWIVLEHPDADLGIYTHWYGTEAPAILQNALKRQERWGDNAYLSRIIFCAFVKDDVDGETGYGLVAVPKGTDFGEEHPDIRVNLTAQTVHCKGSEPTTFAKFITLAPEVLTAMWA